MIGCDGYRELLTALADGEISGRDRGRVEAHLARCGACRAERDETLAVKGALSEAFADVIASAPAAPDVPAPRPAGRLRRWLPALSGVAAAGIVALFLFVLPSKPVDASPAVLLQRAANRYVEYTDAELWIRLESPVLEGVARALGKADSIPEDRYLRVLVGAPNRVIWQRTSDPSAPWNPERPLAGFDGKKGWDWDPGAGVVRYPPLDGEETSMELDGTRVSFSDGEFNLLRFLSWSFVEELTGEEKEFEILEITGPAARRAGRRVLEVRQPLGEDEDGEGKDGAEDDDGGSLAWARSRVTIDTEHDRIDRFELDLLLAGLSLFRVSAEVAEVNEGVDDAVFRHETHLPEDAEVVDERKKAPAGEK